MAVSVIDSKKKKKIKKLPVADIQSPDEEDEDELLPEGFHLLEESVHCMNIRESDGFRAYLNQICSDFRSDGEARSRCRGVLKGSAKCILGMQSSW